MRDVVTGGRKIAIVSATEIERFYHFTQKAQKEKPGVLKTQQEEVWKKELKRAKKNSDYVIAYVHWGTEGKIHYGQDQTEIADLCVKAGADAVIGGHPHRLQGVEFIKNVPVAYSVGNFWFSTGKLYTTIAQIQIDDSGSLKLRMIPCIQDSLTTSILTEKNRSKHFIIIWQTSPIMWELMRTDSFIRIKMSKNRELLLMPIRPEGVMDSILMMWIWI